MNFAGERLTAMRGLPAQRAASAQAVSSTQASIAGIRPISSATGMKSAGDSRPRAGWFQRSKASTLTIAPAARSTIG